MLLVVTLFAWLGAICICVVLAQIGRSAVQCFRTWHRERRRYKLPKPPDGYRLN